MEESIEYVRPTVADKAERCPHGEWTCQECDWLNGYAQADWKMWEARFGRRSVVYLTEAQFEKVEELIEDVAEEIRGGCAAIAEAIRGPR